MSLLLVHGRPALCCDKCCQRFGVTELFVIRWTDLESVSLMCEPCAESLFDCWSVKEDNKDFEVMEALRYFQQLTGGRNVATSQPKTTHAPILQAPARHFVLPPPPFNPQDVR
jgi:hypothetical protein